MKTKTLAWQLMSHPVKVLPESIGIREAAETLHEWGITGAPVVDGLGKVVGVLSLRDLAASLAARLLKLPALFPTLEAPGTTDDVSAVIPSLEELEGAKVLDLMTPGIRCVDPDCTIREAIQLMRRHAIHRVFVRRGNGPLKGVITTTDVLRWAEVHQADNRKSRKVVPKAELKT